MKDLEVYDDGSVDVLDTDQHNTIWANHSGHCRLGCAVCTGDDSSESREGVATRRRGACRTLPCSATNDLWCIMAFHVGVFCGEAFMSVCVFPFVCHVKMAHVLPSILCVVIADAQAVSNSCVYVCRPISYG